MPQAQPHPLKIGQAILKGSLGFLFLYFGFRMYMNVPSLAEMEKTGGRIIAVHDGVAVDSNFNFFYALKIHFEKKDHTEDSIVIKNAAQAMLIKNALTDTSRIAFWLDKSNTEPLKQISLDGKVLVAYEPSRAIPIAFIVFGTVLVILLAFVVKNLIQR